MADIRKIMEQMEPKVREAFEAAIADLTSRAQIELVEAALARGNMRDAMLALNIAPEAFEAIEELISEAYRAGGRDALVGLAAIPAPFQPGPLVVRFSTGNSRAEAFIRGTAGERITGKLTEETLAAVRLVLEEGVQNGWGARRTALNLVGRVGRSGVREGGVIGLSPKDVEVVKNVRRYLTEGNRQYLSLKLRNKTFDSVFKKALKTGKPLTADQIDKITGKYASRALRLRGETIARTEVRQATGAGAQEAMQQVVDTGAVRAENVRKIWHATPDQVTRDNHAALHGTSVAMDQPFKSGTSELMFPGDMSLGAAGGDVINCRCWPEYRVDYFANGAA